ncbi:hypothetical protein V493_05329 [Pseudogymnoascus sp. VKM F-4281 (FW-2241)]|nr:hypothetical protein V493_05329 [Pseudogymnoascus sp. VKM F-4281 (FW-2241)]
MGVTEICCMGVKPGLNIMDETIDEGQVLTGAWKAVTSAPGGPHRVYWGLEVEDPSKLWAFFDWDSVEDHDKFARSFGGEAVKELPTILTHGKFTKHVAVAPSPPLALQAPVTGIMLAYFSSDISPDQTDAASANVREFSEKGLSKCSDVKSVSFGWGIENDFPVRGGEEGQTGSVLAAFIGWTSIDAHVEFRETKAFKDNMGLLRHMEGVVKLAMFHVSCQSLKNTT